MTTAMRGVEPAASGAEYPRRQTLLFVGSYGPADRPGILAATLDGSDGELRVLAGFAGVQNPSFLARHPKGGHLYAVGETGLESDGTPGAVHAFRIVREAGAVDLVALNRRVTGGDHPCHLCPSSDGRWLAVSNYGTGSVAVFPVRPDGSLGAMASFVEHEGTGPNEDRQQGPHAHSAVFSPDDRFLIVADLGIDRLVVYAFDAKRGSLERRGLTATAPGAGPRHMAVHPDARHLFVVNELDNTVTCHRWEVSTGGLRARQTLSSLDSDTADTMAADIHVSASGRHVYVSNRGHDSLAVFAFHPSAGLDRVAVRSCGGKWPRGFGLSPGGGHVIVANQHSNEVVVLPLAADGSEVGDPIGRVATPQPSCVVFA